MNWKLFVMSPGPVYFPPMLRLSETFTSGYGRVLPSVPGGVSLEGDQGS